MNDKRPTLLAIDDDESWLEFVPIILENDCEVTACSTVNQGLEAIENHFYDIILLDLNFENDNRSGLDLFKKINALDRGADVIVISGETNHRKLIEAFNAGVSRFISKPAHPDEIRQTVRQVLEQRAMKRLMLSKNLFPKLIGQSPMMQRLKDEIHRVAVSGIKDVLVLGETGTGKELVAELIAQHADPSARFYPLNCSSLHDGLIQSELFGHVKGAFTGADRDKVGIFEAAAGGFVFLDEIGDMPLSQQPKLLRTLQERKIQRLGSHDEKKVNFRTVSATHISLEDAVKEGKFREDLYYRIAREKVKIPALRERPEDISDLVQHMLLSHSHGKNKSITQESIELLQSYSWPGNVRQLQATVEAVSSRVQSNVIRESDICQVLPEVTEYCVSHTSRGRVGRYGASLIQNEKKRFENAILAAKGDRTQAAQALGLSRATFFRRAKDLGLVRSREFFSS
jgi:DNA-binding NtrC family response regulator